MGPGTRDVLRTRLLSVIPQLRALLLARAAASCILASGPMLSRESLVFSFYCFYLYFQNNSGCYSISYNLNDSDSYSQHFLLSFLWSRYPLPQPQVSPHARSSQTCISSPVLSSGLWPELAAAQSLDILLLRHLTPLTLSSFTSLAHFQSDVSTSL